MSRVCPLMRVCLGIGSVLRLLTLWMAASIAVPRVRSGALMFHCGIWAGGGQLSDWTVATHCTVDSDISETPGEDKVNIRI